MGKSSALFGILGPEFIVVLVFLSGIWIRAGIEPSFLPSFHQAGAMSLGPVFVNYFYVVPALAIAFGLASAYIYGGLLGILSIALALGGGFMVERPAGWAMAIAGALIATFHCRD